MKHFVLTAALLCAAFTPAAFAQSQNQTFQGIQGEVQPNDEPLLRDVTGLRFQLGRADPPESSVITESGAGRSDFYRSTIHSGRRAKRSGATGLTIFDRLFDVD